MEPNDPKMSLDELLSVANGEAGDRKTDREDVSQVSEEIVAPVRERVKAKALKDHYDNLITRGADRKLLKAGGTFDEKDRSQADILASLDRQVTARENSLSTYVRQRDSAGELINLLSNDIVTHFEQKFQRKLNLAEKNAIKLGFRVWASPYDNRDRSMKMLGRIGHALAKDGNQITVQDLFKDSDLEDFETFIREDLRPELFQVRTQFGAFGFVQNKLSRVLGRDPSQGLQTLRKTWNDEPATEVSALKEKRKEKNDEAPNRSLVSRLPVMPSLTALRQSSRAVELKYLYSTQIDQIKEESRAAKKDIQKLEGMKLDVSAIDLNEIWNKAKQQQSVRLELKMKGLISVHENPRYSGTLINRLNEIFGSETSILRIPDMLQKLKVHVDNFITYERSSRATLSRYASAEEKAEIDNSIQKAEQVLQVIDVEIQNITALIREATTRVQQESSSNNISDDDVSEIREAMQSDGELSPRLARLSGNN